MKINDLTKEVTLTEKEYRDLTEMVSIEGWIARNGEAAGGDLYLYNSKPSTPDKDSPYEDDKVAWGVKNFPYDADIITELDKNLFKDITFENSPVKVRLLIKR